MGHVGVAGGAAGGADARRAGAAHARAARAGRCGRGGGRGERGVSAATDKARARPAAATAARSARVVFGGCGPPCACAFHRCGVARPFFLLSRGPRLGCALADPPSTALHLSAFPSPFRLRFASFDPFSLSLSLSPSSSSSLFSGEPDRELVEKIRAWRKQNFNPTANIKRNKEFGNPQILQKVRTPESTVSEGASCASDGGRRVPLPVGLRARTEPRGSPSAASIASLAVRSRRRSNMPHVNKSTRTRSPDGERRLPRPRARVRLAVPRGFGVPLECDVVVRSERLGRLTSITGRGPL